MTRSAVYRSVLSCSIRHSSSAAPLALPRSCSSSSSFSTSASSSKNDEDNPSAKLNASPGSSSSSTSASASASTSKLPPTPDAPPRPLGYLAHTASLPSTPPESRAPFAPLPYLPTSTYGLPFPLARPVSVPSPYPGQLPVKYTNWPLRVVDGSSPFSGGRIMGQVPDEDIPEGYARGAGGQFVSIAEDEEGNVREESIETDNGPTKEDLEQNAQWFYESDTSEKRTRVVAATMGMTVKDMEGLRRHVLLNNFVSHMTVRGRTQRHQVWVVVGDPVKGMVGMGRGDSDENSTAVVNAFLKAVLSMDYVDRYEGRTIWGQGQEVIGKWVGTKVHMRARPAGFGLMVPHSVHRVLACAGIRDCSAAIHGSTDPVNVAKCVLQMLHGGANPPGFGGGVLGRKGRREDKGWGARSRDQIERERGRWGVDVGRKV